MLSNSSAFHCPGSYRGLYGSGFCLSTSRIVNYEQSFSTNYMKIRSICFQQNKAKRLRKLREWIQQNSLLNSSYTYQWYLYSKLRFSLNHPSFLLVQYLCLTRKKDKSHFQGICYWITTVYSNVTATLDITKQVHDLPARHLHFPSVN